MNTLYKHKNSGRTYQTIPVDGNWTGKVKIQGYWQHCVFYQEQPGGTVYVRTVEDFNRAFEAVK